MLLKGISEKILDNLPPQNIEAEQSVLGCLLIDKEAIIKVADILRPEDFYKEIRARSIMVVSLPSKQMVRVRTPAGA